MRCCADLWRSERCSRKPPWRAKTPTVAAIVLWNRQSEAGREPVLPAVSSARLGAVLSFPRSQQEERFLWTALNLLGKIDV